MNGQDDKHNPASPRTLSPLLPRPVSPQRGPSGLSPLLSTSSPSLQSSPQPLHPHHSLGPSVPTPSEPVQHRFTSLAGNQDSGHSHRGDAHAPQSASLSASMSALSSMHPALKRSPVQLSTMSTSSPRPGPTTLSDTPSPLAPKFDEATHERFQAATGGADIKSEDKEFHMLPGSPHVWAVASGETISREYDALHMVDAHGGPTVLAGRMQEVQHRGKTTQAYPMQWIKRGISSKSRNRDFLAALQAHRDAPELHESMSQLRDVAGKLDVKDFQVLFDQDTRRLIVNDPRGAELRKGSEPTPMDNRLKEWSNAMGLPAPGHGTSMASSTPQALRGASATAAPAPTERDVDFHDRWRRREVEFTPADQLHNLFEPPQLEAFHSSRLATDRGGNEWWHAHDSVSENRVYMWSRHPPTDTTTEVATGPRLTPGASHNTTATQSDSHSVTPMQRPMPKPKPPQRDKGDKKD